ncbi:MAG: hypothetical protein J6X49_17510 [Victivallales bacterium]|nr:hypothetical protein [Victivallales bacterium]
MKKLIATLIMVTLGFGLIAGADPVYTLTDGYTGTFPVLEPVQNNSNNTVYAQSDFALNYTVTESINRILKQYSNSNPRGTKYDLAHVYFTANDDFRLALFVDKDSVPTGELRIDSKLNITDYGIYLYKDNDPNGSISEYISLFNKDYSISKDDNFGVYYTADTTYYVKDKQYNMNGDRENTFGQTYTTAENWVASYDLTKVGNHNINAENKPWYSETAMKTDAALFCLFQGPYVEGQPAYLEWEHMEFGFVTTGKTTGHPLPGTLATILITSFCAVTVRKRNKK